MTTPLLGTPALLAQVSLGGGGSMVPFFLELALIIGIMYFLMIRPQQKQRQKHEATLKALKRGDQIVTAGGIIGEIVHIRESDTKGNDDQITIKSGESRLIVERGRVAKIAGASTGAPESTKS